MPIEAGDMMVILAQKSNGQKLAERKKLAAEMQGSLSVIPNATLVSNNPYKFAFNELLTWFAKTGCSLSKFLWRQDLNILSDLAGNVGSKIKSVAGVEDLICEEVTGIGATD